MAGGVRSGGHAAASPQAKHPHHLHLHDPQACDGTRRELTGSDVPCRMSADARRAATPEMIRLDREVRPVIAEELGHGRLDVLCTAYLGSPLGA